MKRLFTALLGIALWVGLTAPLAAETTTTGFLNFSSLNHTDQKVRTDTLLGGASDTTSSVRIRDAKRVAIYVTTDKVVSTGDITITHQASLNRTDWGTLGTSTVAVAAAGTSPFVLLNSVVSDSSDFASLAAAEHYRAILTKADGTGADSAMVRVEAYVQRE